MKSCSWFIFMALIVLPSSAFSQNRIHHNDQDIFLSGMNLAWVNFAQDLTGFNEPEFTRALDEISNAGGNSLRWWLHVNGTFSPKFTGDSVSSITATEIQNMKKGLDLAKARGMGIIMCLWSFDMLRSNLSPTILNRNRLILTDTAHSKAYINNALIPALQEVGEHPAVICWEVFNEPEGMSNEFGWSDISHVSMNNIVRFVNLVAGAVHREAPTAKVSNGSWCFYASSTVSGYTNYYSDDSLIAAGGDPQGTLDFYMVHYYDWGGTAISPFNHPKSYWGLDDKPLVIGEFAAHGPMEGVDPVSAYQYLYDNGYAGALSWTWTGHDGNGNVNDVTPAMLNLYYNHDTDIVINYAGTGVNYIPKIVNEISDTMIAKSAGSISNFANLKEYFLDEEDSTDLTFSISGQTNTSVTTAEVTPEGIVDLTLNNTAGVSHITVRATDNGNRYAESGFSVSIYDPELENKALYRKAWASSTLNLSSLPVYAVDGNDTTTLWASRYENDQWIAVKLDQEYTLQGIILNWGSYYCKDYEIQVSDNGQDWVTAYHETDGNGQEDKINIGPVAASYIRMIGARRYFGYTLLEFEAYENQVVSIKTPLFENDEFVKVFPVPSRDYLTMQTKDQNQISRISIFNSSGQLIANIPVMNLNENNKINISELSPGNYFLNICINNQIILKKFVKQ